MGVSSHTSHARCSQSPAVIHLFPCTQKTRGRYIAPTGSAAVGGAVAERPANAGRGWNAGAETMNPSHATVPFQWGATSGV